MLRRTALFLVIGAFVLPAIAQFDGMGGMPGMDKPKVFPNLKDVKYIRCQVCELLAKNAYKQVKEMFKEATPSKPVTEEAVIERIEKINKPLSDPGEWVEKIDLVEEGDKLVVKEMNQVGDCGVECKTVERAAQDILDDHDTDIAEALFVGKKSRAQFTNWLCYELSNVCRKKAPTLPKSRPFGEPFKPADKEKRQMDKLMAGLKDAGLGGSMMTRDEALNKYISDNAGKYLSGEDDDDDTEPAPAAEGSTVNKLASQAIEKGGELLSKAKDAAGELLGGASAGLQKAKEEAQKIWDKFTEGQKKEKEELAAAEAGKKQSAAEL